LHVVHVAGTTSLLANLPLTALSLGSYSLRKYPAESFSILSSLKVLRMDSMGSEEGKKWAYTVLLFPASILRI
jgi:hypothetical protein